MFQLFLYAMTIYVIYQNVSKRKGKKKKERKINANFLTDANKTNALQDIAYRRWHEITFFMKLFFLSYRAIELTQRDSVYRVHRSAFLRCIKTTPNVSF